MILLIGVYQIFNCIHSHSVSMDHNKPLIVPVGSDALGQIGKWFILYIYMIFIAN